MIWQVILIHRDGDTKTCLGSSRQEAIGTQERVSSLHRGAYVASFMPEPKTTLPTAEARKISNQCRTPSSSFSPLRF